MIIVSMQLLLGTMTSGYEYLTQGEVRTTLKGESKIGENASNPAFTCPSHQRASYF